MNDSMSIKQYVATRAAIIKDEKLLVIRESKDYEGGYKHGEYDLPGGKIKPGESVHDSLVREVREEVGMEITVGDPFYIGEWSPVVHGEKIHIIGIFFVCEAKDSAITLSKDHDDFQWIGKADIEHFPLTDPVPHAMKVLFSKKLVK